MTDRSIRSATGKVQQAASTRAATRKLLAELGLAQATTDEIAAARLTRRHFEQRGLAAMLNIVYRSVAYNALADLYPDLQPWQMGKAPATFWSGPEGRIHAREAMGWLLDRLSLAQAPEEVIYERITYETFRTYHLTAVLTKVYRAGVRSIVRLCRVPQLTSGTTEWVAHPKWPRP